MMREDSGVGRGARATENGGVGYQDIVVSARLAPADTLPGAFERAVEAHRLHIAVASDTWTATYDEFNATANRLAHAILRRGAQPGDRIAILMEHDTPEVAALLAALKAGCIANVLNPSNPPARLRQLIDDSAPRHVVTDRHNEALAHDIAGTQCDIVSFDDDCKDGPDGNPAIVCDPRQTAVLVHSSGSTGIPKGVMQTHAQRLMISGVNTAALNITATDRLALFAPLSYGLSHNVVFGALLNGASLLPFPVAQKGVTGLFEWMNVNGITHYISSASIFRNFMNALDDEARLPRVRAIRLASESATSSDFELFQRHFSESCAFVHTLTCSEATMIGVSRWMPGDAVPKGRLPLRPVDQGQTLLLVDERDTPVPAGEVGEIVVRSKGLAAGYWRNPAMTAERFLPPDDNGDRAYRTGDLARIDSAGLLHFVGRTGTRVKIRGNSIELSEVADAMGRLPDVQQAVADVVERPRHEPVLIGYVVARKGHSLTPAGLRRALRKLLPDHAVPSVMVVLDRFPLMPNGKIDRERLRQLRPQQLEAFEPPQTATETLLAELWTDVFELPSVGRGANFFDLGGDSLIAAVMAARVHACTGVGLTLGAFADHPTLAELAGVIDQQSRQATPEEPPLVRVSRDAPLPLSFAQERIWRASHVPGGSGSYVEVTSYRILGPLDRDALRDCISYIVRRHEVLRTTFTIQDGQPVQIVHPPQPIELPFFDLTGSADAERRAEEAFRELAEAPLDLSRLPLVRFGLIRLCESEHRLQRVIHHIVSDGWSGEVFHDELALLYAAKRRGEPLPLPDHEDLQYADYAAWERNILSAERPALRPTIQWWKDALDGYVPGLRLSCLRPALVGCAWALRSRLERFGWRMPLASLPRTDGELAWDLDSDTSERLENLQRRESVTSYQVRLAAFAALLAADTGRDDILIGSYVTNRRRLPLQRLYGLFINLIPLRFRYAPQKTFCEWLAVVRDGVTAAEAHSMVPFEMLCRELTRQGRRAPKIEVIFQASQWRRTMQFADLEIIRMKRRSEGMPWGFSMSTEPNNCWVTFNAYRYDPVAVRALVGRYQRLLDAVSRHPDMTVGELVAMSRAGAGPIH